MTAAESEPGVVLTQDIRVLAGLQRGQHQPGCTHLALIRGWVISRGHRMRLR